MPDCSLGEENSKTTGNLKPLREMAMARWRAKRSFCNLIQSLPSLSFQDFRISRALTSKVGCSGVLDGPGDPGSLLT